MVTTSSPNSGVTPIPVVRRGGFTLVELMVVIVVIGILAGLLLVAVNKAITTVNEARITVEIGGMQTAMQLYKQDAGGLPPTMCLCMNETIENRQNRFMRHLRKRFPRLVGVAYSNPNKKPPGVKEVIQDNYGVDIDQLDAAESLVFWLAGLPDTTGTEQTKTVGFSVDPMNPFKSGGSRTNRLYEFDPRRLTDLDKDGWWEYVPNGTSPIGGQMPPFVYFDASSYGLVPEYPSASPGKPTTPGPDDPPFAGALGSAWGGVWPYAVEIDPQVGEPRKDAMGNYTGFEAPESFQLISAGLDAIYGNQRRWRDTTNRVNWTEFEDDNLTNFHERRLGTLAN